MNIFHNGVSMTADERDCIARIEAENGFTFSRDVTELALVMIRARPEERETLVALMLRGVKTARKRTHKKPPRVR